MTSTIANELEAVFERYAEPVDRAMRAVVPELDRSGLYRMIRYHLGWIDQRDGPISGFGGKRVRPALVLLAAESVGGTRESALPAAAAVELLHNFSLIHDDIQDRSPERRHRPVVWSIWGDAQAINAGDALHVIASQTILGCRGAGATAEATLEAAILLHDCCLRLVEGQFLDLEYERRNDITPADYFQMTDGKTAALLSTSLEIGAVIGGDAEHRDAWRTAGMKLGRAFQIIDDVLGVWGASSITGKPTADDVIKGKRALPYVLALQNLDASARTELEAIYLLPDGDTASVERAIALIDQSNARQLAVDLAREALTSAIDALRQTRATGPRLDELIALAHFIVERDR